jgi:choline dehydrogenase-like flavoprotein
LAYWRSTPSDFNAAYLIEQALGAESSPDEHRLLRQALDSLENPAICLASTGSAKTFSKRSIAERERLMHAWSISRIPLLRQAFQVLKRLAGYAFFTAPDPLTGAPNPNALVVGYPDPWKPPAQPPLPANPDNPLEATDISEDVEMEADVCIVGSGAGGGVVAALLAEAGYRVVVLESGDIFNERTFDTSEDDGFRKLFAKRGLLASADASVLVLAGRTLGGGTTVNWMTCFRPSERLLKQWAATSGVTSLTRPELQQSLDEVEKRIHVGKEESILNRNNSALLRGAQALGWHNDIQARNAKGCGDCGLCTFGCAWGAKQGTMRTYLQDAYDKGARIVTGATAERVLFKGNQVTGVEARVGPPGALPQRSARPGTHRLTVRAPIVVVAAGGIESPALLLRSGLKHSVLGRNLYLHASTAVIGLFDEEIAAWSGPLQTAHSDQFADMDGEGFGVKFEVTPIYPGLGATALPWHNGHEYKERMLDLKHSVSLLVLMRERVGGRVVTDRWGNPRIEYALSRIDKQHLLRGVKEGARLLTAAGAREADTLHTQRTSIMRKERNNPMAWERFDARVDRLGAGPNNLMLFSAHQMGACRMGTNPTTSVVGENGAVHGYKGLYVADGSIFPQASGVNPMITIMGLAHWIGSRIAHSGLRIAD